MGSSTMWMLSVALPLLALVVGGAFVTGRHRAVGLHFQHEVRRRWIGARRAARRSSDARMGPRRTAW